MRVLRSPRYYVRRAAVLYPNLVYPLIISLQVNKILKEPKRKPLPKQKDDLYFYLSELFGQDNDLNNLSPKQKFRALTECTIFTLRTLKFADFRKTSNTCSTCRSNNCNHSNFLQPLIECPYTEILSCRDCSVKCTECCTWHCVGTTNVCANVNCHKRICDDCTFQSDDGKDYCRECNEYCCKDCSGEYMLDKNWRCEQVHVRELQNHHNIICCTNPGSCKNWHCRQKRNNVCANQSCQKRICDQCAIHDGFHDDYYCKHCIDELEDQSRPLKRQRS